LAQVVLERGLPTDPSSLERAAAHATTPEELVSRLNQPNLLVRLVDASGAALTGLTLPAVYLSREHGPGILRRVRRGAGGRASVEIEGPTENGRRRVVSLSAWLPSVDHLIELWPTAPQAPNLVAATGQTAWTLRHWLARLLGLATLGAVLAAVPALVLREVLSSALPARAPDLLLALTLAAGLAGVQHVLTLLLAYRAERESAAVATVLVRRRFYQHLLGLPVSQEHGRSLGERLLFLREGPALVLDALGAASSVFAAAATLLVATLLLVAWAPVAAGLVVLITLAFGLVSLACAPSVGQRHVDEWQAQAHGETSLEELLRGAEALRACGASRRHAARWLEAFCRERWSAIERSHLEALRDAFIETLEVLLRVTVLGGAALMALSDSTQLGNVLALTWLSGAASSAALTLAQTAGRAAALRPVLARINDLLQHRSELPAPPPRNRFPKSGTDVVQLEDVWFRHARSEPWVLEGYRFSARAGAVNDLVGRNGAGKSTLLRLVAGLLEPERGSIRVFGRLPNQAQDQFLYLPQEIRLSQGTLLENLELLSCGAKLAQLEAAARRTGLDELVASLPMGWDSLIGSGGSGFSGGQRQLIAITGALASDRPLLLLDEPFSQLSGEAIRSLFDRNAFEGRTVLLVHHCPLSQDA
jgi:ABC-type bacteriocin/lantibiotic exporter with double-glycine peptidase domain